GIDAQMPGMVYAAIQRPPVLGSTLKSCDDSAAKQVKGVQQVVTLDLAKPPYGFKALGGPAVIASNSWAAMQGRKRLKVEWNASDNSSFDSAAYKTEMMDTAKKPGRVAREGRQGCRGVILHPHAGSCRDGTVGRCGRVQRRKSCDLGRDSESASGAGY